MDNIKIHSTLKKSAEWLAPVNGFILFGVTVADLTAPALDKWTARLLAVLVGVALFIVAGRIIAAAQVAASQPNRPSVFKTFISDPRNIIASAVLLGAVFFFGSNLSYAKENGVMAEAIPGLQSLQTRLFGIEADIQSVKSDTKAIRTILEPTDVVGKLRSAGYGLDEESKARAIEACDINALKLYIENGEILPLATPIFGMRAGSNLERPIIAKNPRLLEVVELLAKQGLDLNQRFPLTLVQSQTGQIPQFDELAAIYQKRTASINELMPVVVQANALTLAVWANNSDLVRKLVTLDANPETGVDAIHYEFNPGMREVIIPLSSSVNEAKRLGRENLFLKR